MADKAVKSIVATIMGRVRRQGDLALHELAFELDGMRLEDLEVTHAQCDRALEELEPTLRAAMERAVRNITRAHSCFAPVLTEVETEPGVTVGRRPDPLGCVGIYAPGGRASYPSSLLMCAVPARIAGVREIVVCSPKPTPVLLAAAALARVDRVFAIGGAGAIAAMAYGTESVPRVDKIVGPGNAFVCEAKLQVCGEVAIDTPAGPSELVIVADETADEALIEREAAAQQEHDLRAKVVTIRIASGSGTANRIKSDLVVDSVDAAVAYVNEAAPEHVLLAVRDPETAFASVRNAGAVFLGTSSSVVLGDYMTGANHVLPTGGLARCYSGLSTLDFVRWTSYQKVSAEAARSLARDVAVFAEAEGLPAHAAAAEVIA
jgi:histidinol dehydrogenase